MAKICIFYQIMLIDELEHLQSSHKIIADKSLLQHVACLYAPVNVYDVVNA